MRRVGSENAAIWVAGDLSPFVLVPYCRIVYGSVFYSSVLLDFTACVVAGGHPPILDYAT